MNVGITYDLKEDWATQHGEPDDANAEFDLPQTIDLVISALESGGHTVRRIGNVKNLMKKIDELDVDIIFNMCEGKKGRNRESEAPILLEMQGIPFVGADALTLGMTLDKVMTKKLFICDGISTPRFFTATSRDDLNELNTIGFPLIVKTRYEGTSKGITNDSLVKDFDSLTEQVEKIEKEYYQPAIIEEFVSGTEFTVPVLGNKKPEAIAVIQVSINGSTELGDEFYTNERVYNDDVNYICPAKISKELTELMKDLAVKVYNSVECRDFGRVDFRVDENGNPYVLEINPLPSLAINDVFNIYPQTIGTTYDATINRVLDHACERYGLLKEQDKENILEQTNAASS